MKLKKKLHLLAAVLAVDCLLLAGLVKGVFVSSAIDASLHASSLELMQDDSDNSQEKLRKDKKKQDEKLLALTFDDGPHDVYTKKLLDGLKERDVKVSFFLVGENIEGNEELVKRMEDEGHLVGTHCYSHVDLTKKKMSEACDQILRTNELIRGITGMTPAYIRPPYGAWNKDLEEQINMTPVLWDVDPLDWKVQNKQKVVRHILKNADQHEVILLHDVFDTSVDAALEVIDTLKKQGYTFVTVDELLID